MTKGTKDPVAIKENKEMRELRHLSEQGRLNYLKHRQLRHLYGMSFQDYTKRLESQGGCCAICGSHHSIFTRNLHVDHDHKTGSTRDLLCSNCNMLVGRARDDTEILASMIEYLTKWNDKLSR